MQAMPQAADRGTGRAAVRTAVVALQVLVLAATTAHGQSGCPNHTQNAFPPKVWSANASCSVIKFVGRRSPSTPLQNPLWEDGLRMYANFTNAQGGLRLGEGQIGYVEVEIQDASNPRDPSEEYINLCSKQDVDVLLAPVASDVALDVLKKLQISGCDTPFIAADTSEKLFELRSRNLWSVEGWNATQKGGAAIDFLHALGARSFAVVAKNRDEYKDIASALATAIFKYTDSKILDSRVWKNGVSMINEIASEVEAKKPDVFLAVGDLDMFETLLDEFKGQKYAPDAAVFMEGLAVSPHMVQQSYSTKGCSQCFVYNQWMGTVPWSEQMPYHGQNNWTAIQPHDRYHDHDHPSSGRDRRDDRYMGSAGNFAKYARRWLKSNGNRLRDPDAYHAKAFASMLLIQMVVELAEGNDGWGLTRQDLHDGNKMRKSAAHLSKRSGVQTFWGKMKLRADGFNEGFEMGIAQFQGHDTVPTLVGPPVFHPTEEAVYPALWPCNLFGNCDITQGWSLWEVVGALFLGGFSVCVLVGCYVKQRNSLWLQRTWDQIPFLHRPSVFESRSTDSLLLEGNVEAAWYESANVSDAPLDPAPDSAPPFLADPSRKLRRQHSARAPVLFRDKDISNLRPGNWKDHTIGKGSYGTVYRATWEGKEVAVKELQIPEEHPNLTEKEKEAFIERAKELRSEFLKELKVSCDLNHPNLVRLLGWATHEVCPIVVQEYLGGKSLDHQLYVEKWKPTKQDVLKIALDVAKGMEYLHTAFVNPSNEVMPVIHRDLKSPNLLLLHPPPDFNGGQGEKGQVWVKIADFGLARNKKLDPDSHRHISRTGMMTGCGSILWMAPEILLGETYNEKVDVFSYAMCMLELQNLHLPWQGAKQRTDTTQVPYKVTRGERPTWQLQRDKDGNPKTSYMNTLIQRCWDQTAARRPDFDTIVVEIQEQYTLSRRTLSRRASEREYVRSGAE